MIKNLQNSKVTSMNAATPVRKKQYVTNAFKYLLAISSMAGTLGIWNLLANKDLVNAQVNNDEIVTPVTEFDPLPTLVPILTVDLSSLQRGGGAPTDVAVVVTEAAPLREVAVPVATVVSPIILSGGNASSSSSGNQNAPAVNSSSPAASAPNPVTTTQSSKP